MASGTAAPNYHNQLTAAAVDTVTMNTGWEVLEVVNVDGAAAIYYTVDGSTPTIGGSNCRVLPASISIDTPGVPGGNNAVVKLISSGTPHYSIIGGL